MTSTPSVSSGEKPMHKISRRSSKVPLGEIRSSIQALILATITVSLIFLWQGNKGFNLWDEGFLWYGAQRVMVGEVPLRDFMSYDPGRYYWSASLMGVLGDNGIMSMRTSVAVFQTLGLFTGLLLIARSMRSNNKESILFLIVAALTLVTWMFPYYKLFDISLSIFLIGTLTFLAHNPSARRYFISGVFIGLIAFFGRNHGVYGVAGSLGVIIWLHIKSSGNPGFIKGLALWVAGVTVGYAPVLMMALFIPGFAAALWRSIYALFERMATNLPLPVPWPWTVSLATVPLEDAIRGILIGLFFMGTLFFGVVAVVWVLLQKFKGKPVPSALVASAFLALPYAHYAFSRADEQHLALGIFPLLVGCLIILSTREAKTKWPFALALCASSIWVTHVFHPGWQCQATKQCVNVEISGNHLKIPRGTADDIALLRQLADLYAPNGQTFIATPFWPGAYALFEQRSPMWAIYALFPRSIERQQGEIERIKAAQPHFAVILDLPLDGRDELRFMNTNPLINQYIIDNFDLLPEAPNPAYQIYKAKVGLQ